jgi:hypothetical protein
MAWRQCLPEALAHMNVVHPLMVLSVGKTSAAVTKSDFKRIGWTDQP